MIVVIVATAVLTLVAAVVPTRLATRVTAGRGARRVSARRMPRPAGPAPASPAGPRAVLLRIGPTKRGRIGPDRPSGRPRWQELGPRGGAPPGRRCSASPASSGSWAQVGARARSAPRATATWSTAAGHSTGAVDPPITRRSRQSVLVGSSGAGETAIWWSQTSSAASGPVSGMPLSRKMRTGPCASST